MCNEKLVSINHFFIHLNIFHDIKGIGEFHCKEQNCMRIFTNKDAFRRHLKCHNYSSSLNIITPNSNPTDIINSSESVSTNTSIESYNLIKSCSSSDDLKNVLHSNSLSLICKWYSDSIIPRNKVQHLIDDVQELNDSFLNIFVARLNKCLSISNDSNVKDELPSLLNLVSDFLTPFENMKTEYLRFQTLERLGVLIRPEEKVVRYKLDDRLINGKVDVQHKAVNICLIPLRIVF